MIGAPFLVMTFVEGTTIRSPEDGAALGGLAADCTRLLIDQLARLHVIDPGEVGLTDFGTPQGYLGRQVRAGGVSGHRADPEARCDQRAA